MGTDLIRAHSKLGDFTSARNVLASLDEEFNEITREKEGIDIMKWPGDVKIDTKCYNTVLAAAVNSKDLSGIDTARDLFNSMAEPMLFAAPRPKKNAVSYNTMIGAYARVGNRAEAFAVFNEMREAGVKPDKYTI